MQIEIDDKEFEFLKDKLQKLIDAPFFVSREEKDFCIVFQMKLYAAKSQSIMNKED